MKKILILCGPPGVGKTTIANYLVQAYGFKRVITHTTRVPRPNEQTGRDYYFETEKSFFTHQLLEYVKYDHHWYGSSLEALNAVWATADQAVIILDTKGAETYLQKLGRQAICWYIISSSWQLNQRLLQRGVDGRSHLLSREGQRDSKLPAGLQGKCWLLENNKWEKTLKLITQLLAQANVHSDN
ncbi:guanylate kinase [Liquorilactobacillus sicerae]|uniref:guanylate kinase n=1 Tax=Liquorilactobacillus sicerae TaxID=1416943 RepID=UPI002480EFD6|nr:guanylate kinase [Liquorilactobacillus sicerae]